jgi:hypothetical protein
MVIDRPMTESTTIKTIVLVGGGPAGWIAA